MSADLTFTAAMVQMRTGLLPEPSLDQGARLIREAAAAGADYVLTPEVSNMMQLNRTALFEHLQSEDDDRSLAAYRELARELKIHLHIGSLALRAAAADKAVNRSFLIGPSDERWDLAMLVRQSSLQAFMAMASNEPCLAGLGHRTAAIEDSRLLPLLERLPQS